MNWEGCVGRALRCTSPPYKHKRYANAHVTNLHKVTSQCIAPFLRAAFQTCGTALPSTVELSFEGCCSLTLVNSSLYWNESYFIILNWSLIHLKNYLFYVCYENTVTCCCCIFFTEIINNINLFFQVLDVN